MSRIKPLPDAAEAPGVDTSQRYLVGAHQSVSGLLETLDTLREFRRKEIGDTWGQLPENELDLIRDSSRRRL
jgi:hypothetical protein